MSDDRPKKSWREIDAGRDRNKTRGEKREPGAKSREKVEQSAAYKKYKTTLDKLFTPGSGQELPPELKEKLGPTDDAGKRRAAMTQALHDAATETGTLGNAGEDAGKRARDKLESALKAYLAAGLELPEDPRLLMQLLDVFDPALVLAVLNALQKIIESGKKPSRMLLIQKLDAVALRLGTGEAADLARTLRADL